MDIKRRWKFREFQSHKRTIIAAYLSGMSTAELGKQHDVSTSHVRKYLKQWDVPLRTGGRAELLHAYATANKKFCCLCGNRDSDVLVYHHRNSSEKVSTISKMVRKGVSLPVLQNEIAKCVVICSNCHHRLHRFDFADVLCAMSQV